MSAVKNKMKVVTTRKSHDCFTCGKPISKGDKAKTVSTKFISEYDRTPYFETTYFHMNCPIKDIGELR